MCLEVADFCVAFAKTMFNKIDLFRDPERTASVLDSEGWLHTGDVGEWLPNGTLKIIDHKKTIFKLSRGEYVAPDKVEEIYKRSPYIAQVGDREIEIVSLIYRLKILSGVRCLCTGTV